MASIVNARDVELQAAATRLLGVTLKPNVQVSPDNVTGLGLIIEGTKQLYFSSTSQIFQIPTSGPVSPANITLTANARNIAGTIALTIVPGSGTMSVIPSLTAGVFTFTAAQMLTDTVTFRISLTEGSTTYIDDLTVVKIAEGSDGITGLLTNESFSLPGDSVGNVTNYAGCNGNFKVFQGINDVTTACTFSIIANADSVGVNITATGGSAGTYSLTSAYPTTKDIVTVTFRAVFGTVNIDKVFSVVKAKTGANGAPGAPGANGTNGTNGVNGTRGSKTFYVAVSATSWSDSTATSAASVDGGPVLNDLVTQYNEGAGFSQSRFWNGSSWLIVNAVVDGNLLVSGTVGAKALVLNNGSGNNMWPDPNYSDPAGWQFDLPWPGAPVSQFITDGVSGNTSLRSPTNGQAAARGLYRIPVHVGKQYRISFHARKTADANGSIYFRLDGSNQRSSGYDQILIGFEGITAISTGALQEFSTVWTATTPFVSPMALVNYEATAGWMEVQNIRIEQLTDSALIVSGGITADRIDSRGLSIKDSAGNVILAAGSALDYSYITPSSGWLNSNITVSGGAITGIGTGAGTVVANNAISIGSNGALSGAGGGQVTLPGMGLRHFRVGAYGFSATGVPIGSELRDADTNTTLVGGSAMYHVAKIERSTGIITSVGGYNTLSGAGAGPMASALNAIGNDHIVVIYTYDEPQGNRLTSGLDTAMYRCGASRAIFGSPNFAFRSAYILIGIPGCGEGNGFESYAGVGASDPNAWCDVAFSVRNGNFIVSGASKTPNTLADYSYTGDLNATVGATFGVNIGGQITAATASTYIANAAIADAQIGNLNAAKIVAGTITVDKLNVTALQVNIGSVFSEAEYFRNGFNTVAFSLAGPTVVSRGGLWDVEFQSQTAAFATGTISGPTQFEMLVDPIATTGVSVTTRGERSISNYCLKPATSGRYDVSNVVRFTAALPAGTHTFQTFFTGVLARLDSTAMSGTELSRITISGTWTAIERMI